jgi:hypothetical protein
MKPQEFEAIVKAKTPLVESAPEPIVEATPAPVLKSMDITSINQQYHTLLGESSLRGFAPGENGGGTEAYTMEDEELDGMALGELQAIAQAAKKIFASVKQGVPLEAWMYKKITNGNEGLTAVAQQINNPAVREQPGVAEGAPIIVMPSHKRLEKKHKPSLSRGMDPAKAQGEQDARDGKPYNNPYPFKKELGAPGNWEHNSYKASYDSVKQGVAEGSISDLLNKDPTSPKFNDHSAPRKTKHSGSTPTPYEQGRLDAHRKKSYNNIHNSEQDAEDYKTGYRHVKSRQGVAEGLEDTQKKIEDTINKLEDRLKHAKTDEQWDNIKNRIERLQAGLKRSKQGVAEGEFTIKDDPSAHIRILFLKTINGNEYRLVKQGNVYKIYINSGKKQVFSSFDLAKKALQQLLLNAVHTDDPVVAEGFPDDILAMAKKVSPNARTRGSRDEEIARRDAMLAQRAQDHANAPKPKGVSDDERASLEAELQQLMPKYDRHYQMIDNYTQHMQAKHIADRVHEIQRKLKPGVAEIKDPNDSRWSQKYNKDLPESTDYASAVNNLLNEFAGGMGVSSVAVGPGAMKNPAKTGSLFGGSYTQKNSPFKKKATKKESVIKR